MARLSRKVAARWALKQAFAEWNPPIPQEALDYFKVAYIPNTPELRILDEARESIAVFLPKILDMLKRQQGDRYFMNSSESHGKIFYFFQPRQPIDAFNLTLWIDGDKANVVFGYTPRKLDGSLDFKGMVQERGSGMPEIVGMTLMRLVRSVLSKI